MSTWAVPSAGTGLAYMSLHVSRARLHESSSSADYLLGKSKGNGRKVRALRPLPLHMRPCSHAASTFAQVDCAFFWVLFHDPGRHPCILVEMNAPPTAKFDCTCRRTKSSTRLRPTSLGRHGRAAALPRRARFRLAPLLVGSLWVIALFRELQNPLPVLAVGSVCVRAHRAAWPYPPRASGVRHHEHVATCYHSLVKGKLMRLYLERLHN